MNSISAFEDKIDLVFYKKDGNEFEDFIIRLYKIKYPDLLGVKPQGQKGDGANDGYLSGKLLLQVYAPEKLNAKDAIKKLEHDFYRAKDLWGFNEWHFILNDKFQTIHRDIHHSIDELKKNNPDIDIKLIDSESLKNMFLDLLPNNKLKIYVLLKIGKDISEFNDFGKVEQVIDVISHEQEIRGITDKDFLNFSKEIFLPDGIKKLEINIKDEEFSRLFGTYIEKSQEVIEVYIPQIGLELFEDIGEYIQSEYNKYSKSIIPEKALFKTYEIIYSKLDDDRNLETALWIVIAYFFDICDIGETI